jgi:hypothetical protein
MKDRYCIFGSDNITNCTFVRTEEIGLFNLFNLNKNQYCVKLVGTLLTLPNSRGMKILNYLKYVCIAEKPK